MSSERVNLVGWVEIPVSDMERAKKFYQTLLSVELEAMEMNGMQMATFPMKHDKPGASGALIKGGDFTPSMQGSVVYFSVESIEKTANLAEDAGGQVVLPKISIGEHGFISHVKDSEGNRIALHCMK